MKRSDKFGEQAARTAASVLAERLQSLPASARQIGVILGSGLGHAADVLVRGPHLSIPYSDIPGMPVPRVVGHEGCLIVGTVAGATVYLLKGRVHYYEGHSLAAVTFATRVLYHLGVSELILTNAAGGIRAEFQTGHLMLISGHIEWPSMSLSCIAGNPESEGAGALSGVCRLFQEWGMPPAGWPHSNVWSARLRSLSACIPSELSVHQGVYALMSGPNYETPAEVRAARWLGADAVGMSTVPEAVTAAQRGMNVLGVSCITNIASGLSEQKLDHADVTRATTAVRQQFSEWLWKVIHRMASEDGVALATRGAS